MNKKYRTTSWSWKMTPEELKDQVDNYNTLKITQSYRGVSVIIISALLLLSIILGLFDIYSLNNILLSLFIYIPVLFFVYKGHRWAIITLFALWTIEKGYTLYLSSQTGGNVIGSIIWWLIVSPYIYKALIVENEYRKNKKSTEVTTEGFFCTKCGTHQVKDAKFCKECGASNTNKL